MADNIYNRGRVDAELQESVALPNAANTASTDAIDLETTDVYPINEDFQVRVRTTTAAGSNSKNINVRIMHSDEASANFTNLTTLPNPVLTVTDNANAGFAVGEAIVSLPSSTKRYIKAAAVGEANGGNAANGTLTIELLF